MVKRLAVMAMAAAFLMDSGGSTMAAGKGKPVPVASWPCSVTLRDAVGDVIRSDGKDAYVNGLGGVLCTIDPNPGSTHFGWLNLRFASSSSPRFITYLGQAQDVGGGPGYNGMDSRGTFEVKGLTQILWNGNSSYYDIMPFRANQSNRQFLSRTGQFSGDSNLSGAPWSTGSSSVFVQPRQDGCTWDVWFDPGAPEFFSPTGLGDSSQTRHNPRVIQLKEASGYTQTRGYYAMPFGATIRIIGVKDGC